MGDEVPVVSSAEKESGDEEFLSTLGTGSIGRSKACSRILDLNLTGGEYHGRGGHKKELSNFNR